MRKKCGRGDRSVVLELTGPRLESADDAAAALRLSFGSAGQEGIVLLVCDYSGRLQFAADFEGAPAHAAPAVLECVVDAMPEDSSVVLGLFRPEGSTLLDRNELEAVGEVELVCVDAGIRLLDVIVLSDHGWRSAAPDW